MRSFTCNHITHWEFSVDRGAPGHSPNAKGSQTVNVSAGVPPALTTPPHLFSLGHLAQTRRPTEAQPTHRPCRLPGSGVGALWRAKGTVGEGRQDLPQKIAGPWEMYNLRTPLFFLEGKIDMYILKSFSL